MLTVSDSITALKGVGKTRAQALSGMGIETIGNLLGYYPRAYEDRTRFYSLKDAGDLGNVCIHAVVGTAVQTARLRKNLSISKCRIYDESGTAEVVFFNRSYLEKQLFVGGEYIFYGKVTRFGHKLQLDNPQFERVGKGKITGKILPIYPLTAGITRNFMVDLATQTLSDLPPLAETLPADIVAEHGLLDWDSALRTIHFPPNHEALQQAVNRISFDELLVYSTALCQMKHATKSAQAPKLSPVSLNDFFFGLPYELTGAQKRVVLEILDDMTSGKAMNRLVQGDVGSGKTVVAACAVYIAAKNGKQSAVMAPTEILASQHYKGLAPMLAKLGIRCALLQSSTQKKEKTAICAAAAAGEIDLLIGTHALLEDSVTFQNPALFVIDEQHRFGVRQRAKLVEKGKGCHTLVMSATPIPRTLNLIIYGELDVSVIDELPPGRQKIETFAVTTAYDERLHAFMNKQITAGGQCYIVCPLALENEESDLASAQEYAAEIARRFPKYKVDMLHGKLKSAEKEQIISSFSANTTQILVSTTVVEVGVDIPNANLMIVRNAERFGLSQLHQLRGRVGRGSRQSYCVLVSDTTNPDTKHRLEVMTKTDNGFEIAQEDLKIRGPGDFFGQAQHGLPCYSAVVMQAEMAILAASQNTAEAITQADPLLEQETNRWLLHRVQELRARMGKTGLN